MHDDLSTPYSFFDKDALSSVADGTLRISTVVGALKFLDTVRDVADGTAAVLSMAVNVNVLENSDDECQVCSSSVFRLQTLCTRAQEMLSQEATRLINSVNEEACSPREAKQS